jgi:hypothetical protein
LETHLSFVTLCEEYTDRFLYAKSRFSVALAGLSSGSIDFRGGKGQYVIQTFREDFRTVEITKALAALQPLYGKDNVEIITTDGRRVRGTVRSMKTTQALTTPSVKMQVANGQIVKIPFPTIAEIKDHNTA